MTRNVQIALAGVGAFVAAMLVSRRASKEPASGGGGLDVPPGALPVDPYATHQPAAKGERDLWAKPGVLAFRKWALARWGQKPGSPENIVANKDGEHGVGKAWDLMTISLEHGQGIVDELLASEGNEPHALARRAGIQYLIWDRQIWRAYPWQGKGNGEWGLYTGASPHTDHIHFSFGDPGAFGETSLYRPTGPAPIA